MPILLHKRIWAFVGQIMLTGSKGSWVQFVFVCRSHSARELYYAADLYFAADLRFAIDLYTKGFEKGLGPNLSSSAKAILPRNCILWQICILLQICVLLYIAFTCTYFFGPFLLFGLLGGSLGLAFHWVFLRMGLWAWIQKMGVNNRL